MGGGAAAVATHEVRAPPLLLLPLGASSCGLVEGSLARCCALAAAVGGGAAAVAAHEVRAPPLVMLLLDASSRGLAEGPLARCRSRKSPLRTVCTSALRSIASRMLSASRRCVGPTRESTCPARRPPEA